MPTSTVFPYSVRILVENTGIRFARLKYGKRIAKNTKNQISKNNNVIKSATGVGAYTQQRSRYHDPDLLPVVQ